MYVIRKLKPDYDFYGILVPFAAILIGTAVGVFVRPSAGFLAVGLFFAGYALISLLTLVRTRNTGFLVMMLFQVSGGLVCYTMPLLIDHGTGRPLLILFQVCTFFFLIWLMLLVAGKKLKWRGREILELAGNPVEEIGNGYTPRPLPVGKTNYSDQQILSFSAFALKNLIAMPYIGKNKVVFVPVKQGNEFSFVVGMKTDYANETWVSFDFEGKVTVNISRRDYLNFKEPLAFDKLCTSLGNLFIELVDLYLRGEGERIIDRMNSVGVPYYS